MSELIMIQLSKSDFQTMLDSAATTAVSRFKNEVLPEKKYSKSAAQRYLRIGYKRINTLITKGLIIVGADGLILQSSLDSFLNNSVVSSVTDHV